MDYKYIEQLLERYWNCETSVEEEQILRIFFQQKELPAHLRRYRSLFTYQEEAAEMKLGDDFDKRVLAEIERPVVKAEQGKLVYDVPRLVGSLPVDNAYDAVKNLPGVVSMNDALTLGGQPVTVVINGKVTTLSVEQLYTLLRSIPASRIEKAEVMYNAPARYQVRGALINVQLKQTADGPSSWQGELYGKYNQKHYEGFEELSLIHI